MHYQWLVFGVICLALIADHPVFWRGFQRRVTRDATRARRTLWTQWISMLWICSAFVMALWIAQDLPAAALGLQMPTGLRLWIPLALIAALVAAQLNSGLKVARMPERTRLRQRFGTAGQVVPHTASELPLFLGMSLSAGFCEELLIRGFMIWLFQPLVGWWIAAVVSLVIFTLAHIYQGVQGMIQCAVLSAVMTAFIALSHSLWPAIVLHAAIDWMGGWTGWLVFREPEAASPTLEPTSPR